MFLTGQEMKQHKRSRQPTLCYISFHSSTQNVFVLIFPDKLYSWTSHPMRDKNMSNKKSDSVDGPTGERK